MKFILFVSSCRVLGTCRAFDRVGRPVKQNYWSDKVTAISIDGIGRIGSVNSRIKDRGELQIRILEILYFQ